MTSNPVSDSGGLDRVLIGAAVGAILGALFGYSFAWFQKRREVKAKREYLLKALHRELSSIDSQVQPYNPNKVIFQDPIRLSAPDRLLDSETLEYRKDSNLIEALLILRVALAKYNDLIEVTNLAQSIAPIQDTAHLQMYNNMVQRHSLVVTARDAVLKLIPRSGSVN